MTIIREERIGGQRLILGNNRAIIPALVRFDAVVTDPPYGIGAERGIGSTDRVKFAHKVKGWDREAPDVASLLGISEHQIIWGGNYFDLPPTRCVLVWDKNNAGRHFADFELAWTNLDMVARRIVQVPWNMDGGKQHPTQKPIRIMQWCMRYLPNSQTVLDPFMGSGTTLVVCQQQGRAGTGIEIDPEYFDIACRRVDEAVRQPDLFAAAPAAPVLQEQLSLEGDPQGGP